MDYTNLTKEQYLELWNKPLDELIEISSSITKANFTNEIESCSILSAKTGACSENCKYCAQSQHNHAEIECHPLLDVETVVKAALSAKENGATRFGIVTSGKAPTKKEFETLLEMIRAVSAIEGLECCLSLGILSEEQVIQIKEAGVTRFNHNINTSERYYSEICSTHKFEDRLNTVKLLRKHGIDVCCGVILGMGETVEDRIDMAFTLREVKPATVPINVLNPIKGTPLEDYIDKISEEDILKSICLFRMILPHTLLKYAGGRTLRLSRENQKLGLIAGINSMMVGNYLTTKGSDMEDDRKMLKEVDLVMV
ncbi:TPA: biotin synthase BioB [Candidatus Gastranaerophilales bacterium HUM_9]|nr:MAG TPA: biotin synthase BioB [Candidatus Gastranaerophilales bacterium HUM_9]HBX34969.1 biotin synthase BioB [Cyanobacteria bacterium UBA11440]